MSQETTSNFTPGPWEWRRHPELGDGYREVLKASDGASVLSWNTKRTDARQVNGWTYIRVSDADARLLAAAPDLYVALKLLRGLHRTWQTDMTLMVGSSVWKLMNDAIAKVEGRAS